MQGWVKLHRSKLKWEWFTDYKTSHLFEYLILKASHNDYRFKGVQLKAGQLPFGLHKASIECGLSIQMIRTSLDKLISTNEVTKESSRQGTVITIVNWEKYQIATNDLTSHQQLINKQSTTTKKVNNVKNEKKYKSEVEKIVNYLNNATGKNYKASTQKTEKLISSLLEKKYTPENFTHVIDVKCQEWLDDDKMKNFLRPETLFGSKFESYLNQEKKLTESDLEKMFDSLGRK